MVSTCVIIFLIFLVDRPPLTIIILPLQYISNYFNEYVYREFPVDDVIQIYYNTYLGTYM